MTQERYVVLSLELHMFFGRTMMEHALFIEAMLMPANSELTKTAKWFKEQYEAVLHNAVILGDGVVDTETLASGEMITTHTHACEQLTRYFLNNGTNQEITKMQKNLSGAENPYITPVLISQVRQLNAAIAPLIDSIVEFKRNLLVDLHACRVFIADNPLLIRSMLSQAVYYKDCFAALESGNECYNKRDSLISWTHIILEQVHINRTMFDPTEKEIIDISDGFMRRYSKLMRETRMMRDALAHHNFDAALKEIMDYRDFNETVVKRLAACEIHSGVLPQMADHLLREINYFVRLLKKQSDVANYLSQ